MPVLMTFHITKNMKPLVIKNKDFLEYANEILCKYEIPSWHESHAAYM